MALVRDAPFSAVLRQPVDQVTIAAMLLAPVGIAIACAVIPSGVDELPTSRAKTARTLETVSHHAFATRLGFLTVAVAMLCLIPAMSVVRTLTSPTAPGRVLVDVGARFVAIAGGAIAIGNAFAPASEPSAIRHDLPRAVRVTYMRHHLLNGWDWTIIAFYPLITIGAALLGVGLWRSRTVNRVTTLLVTLPLAALLVTPLRPATIVVAVALGAGFVMVAAEARARLPCDAVRSFGAAVRAVRCGRG